MKFEPGVLTEVFDFLKLKVHGLTELERECVLTLDEMAITPSMELHMLTGKLYGDVTSPGHTGAATHACVFMLAGNTLRWKQVVVYHFSGSSNGGAEHRPIITEIIQTAASIYLRSPPTWAAITGPCGNPLPDVPHLVKKKI